MRVEYATAVVTAERFTQELEALSMAEREHILKQFLSDLPFCKDCGSSSCRGHCENDE